jgi:hypothetical protein
MSEQFYWNAINQQLVGSEGTILSLEVLHEEGDLVSHMQLRCYYEVYRYEGMIVQWDIDCDIPVSVIDAKTKEKLYSSNYMKKGVKKRGKELGFKHGMKSYEREFESKEVRHKKRAKRKLKRWKQK